MTREKALRLKQSVYRLGYALYARQLITGDGRMRLKGKSTRIATFDKFEQLRTLLHEEHGMMW